MKKLVALVCAVALMGMAPVSGFAADVTWDGGAAGNSNWANDPNWVGDVQPAANDSLFFGGTTRLNTNNNIAAGTEFDGITFNNDAGAFNLNGNAVNLGGDIINNDDNTQTVNIGLTLTGGDRTFQTASTGDLVFTGAIDNGGNGLITDVASGTVLRFSSTSVISGAGGLTFNGDGSLALNGANTYSGGTVLDGDGRVRINNNQALGTGLLTINDGADITNTSGALVTLINNNNININGNFTAMDGSQTDADLDLGTGTVTLGNDSTITVQNGGGAPRTLTIGGDIYESSGLTGITKDGAGTLVLSGSNFCTGDVVLNAGTLTLSGDNTAASGALVLNAGTLNLNHMSAAGSGSVQIYGGSIDNTSGADIALNTVNPIDIYNNFAFTGTNSLDLGTGNTTLGASSTITAANNTLTLGGVIGDGGNAYGITKDGAGTLVLSGNNTYTGLTLINNGTLTLAGSTSGDVTLNSTGALNINSAAALGTGILSINGGTLDNTSAGAVTTTPANQIDIYDDFTFTGTQNLDLGNSAITLLAAPDPAITITVNANTLTLGDMGDGGSGYGMTKDGAGTLILSGFNTYTGTTTMNAGILGLAQSLGTGLNYTGNGEVILAAGRNVNGAITTSANDQGILTFLGGTVLAGDIGASGFGLSSVAFNGLTEMGANNIWATNTTIGAAGTLTSTGTFNGALTNSGILIPGVSAIGALTVNGDYIQNTASALILDVDPASADSLSVTGTATINGGIAQIMPVGFIQTGTYDILTAGTLAGTGFDGINAPSSAWLAFSLDDTSIANTIRLVAVRTPYASVADPSLSDLAAMLNDAAADSPSGLLVDILNALEGMSDPRSFNDALKSLSPEIYGDLPGISIQAMGLFNDSFLQRLDKLRIARIGEATAVASAATDYGPALANVCAECCKPWDIWGKFIGQFADQDNTDGYLGFDYNLYGPAFGIDRMVGDNLIIGASGAYTRTDTDYNDVSANTDVDTYYAGLYGTYYESDRYFIDAGLAYANNSYNTGRNIVVGTVAATATSDSDANDFSAYLGGGFNITPCNSIVKIIPIGSLQYVRHDGDSFTEYAAGAPFLDIAEEKADSLISRLGVRLENSFCLLGMSNIGRISAQWAHEYLDTYYDPTVRFSQATVAGYDAKGVKFDRDRLILGVATVTSLTQDLGLYLNYDFEWRENFDGHTVAAGVKYSF